MDVGLYARVSKEEQAKGESVSIDQQVADMQALCERSGWSVSEVFVDAENYRATQVPRKGDMVNPSGERADRPAFLKMLKLIKGGGIDSVVCWRDDRLVRHPRVAVALEDALDLGDSHRNGRSKIKIVDATGSEIDRFTLSIKATIWREENKRRVERVKMGKIATLQQGRWPGYYSRLGYESVREPGKRGHKIILADEQEVQIVKDIFAWYDSAVPMQEIRNRLLAQEASQKGVAPNQLHDWSPTIIYDILNSEAYTGRVSWRFLDGEEHSIEIPQIIATEQWQRVKAKLDRNKSLSTRNAKGVYLLQSILHCGECGRVLNTNAINYFYAKRADGAYKRYDRATPRHRYRCVNPTMHPEEGHPTPSSWDGPLLDWAVWRYIVENGIKHPELIQTSVSAHIETLQAEGESLGGEVAGARLRLSEVDQERAFYQRQAARGRITEAEFDTRMEETGEARRYWRAEIDRLTELRDNAAKVQSGLDYVTSFLTSLQTELPGIDQTPDELKALSEDRRNHILKTRQRIIRALCDKVCIWSNGQVKLYGLLDGSEVSEFELDRPWRPL